MATHRDGCFVSWSNTIRTARSWTSGENLFADLLVMARPSLELEPSAHSVRFNPASIQVADCAITRLFPDRGYGFVGLFESSKDAFFLYSVVPASDRELLAVDRRLKVKLGADRKGKGLQVKAIVEFLEQQ
jgi:cold shock CspA family protein